MPDLENAGNNAMSGNMVRPPQPMRDLQLTCIEKEHCPSRTEILRNHEITINFFNMGCMVRVGCKSIAFSTTEEAMIELNEYVANPRESTKKWNAIFNKNE